MPYSMHTEMLFLLWKFHAVFLNAVTVQFLNANRFSLHTSENICAARLPLAAATSHCRILPCSMSLRLCAVAATGSNATFPRDRELHFGCAAASAIHFKVSSQMLCRMELLAACHSATAVGPWLCGWLRVVTLATPQQALCGVRGLVGSSTEQ